MSINESGNNAEIVGSYEQTVVTVGTTEVEAKVGSGRKAGRQMLRLFNKSNSIVYFGPTGVTTSTGEPLLKNQSLTIPASDTLALFLIAGSAGNDVIVSEWS